MKTTLDSRLSVIEQSVAESARLLNTMNTSNASTTNTSAAMASHQSIAQAPANVFSEAPDPLQGGVQDRKKSGKFSSQRQDINCLIQIIIVFCNT